MFKQVPHFFAGILLGIAPMWAAASMFTFPANPGFSEPTYSQDELNYAYGQGRQTGRQESASECLASPKNCGCLDNIKPCGVTLTSVLSGINFGETELNDHIVAADGLIPEVSFWGQSKNPIDQDWFYVTTVEPNQIMTVNFTVPHRLSGTTGWLVSVKDGAGNLFAMFDTSFMPDDPNTPNKDESREIIYPVFLGHTGTYYVVVEPSVSGAELSFPYVLAVVLEYSGLDNVPQDVNFHDVEVEANNDSTTANPLASGVTMRGFLHQNEIDALSGEIAGDQDWFSYKTPGNEQISLAWCGLEACDTAAIWTIEVRNPDGSQLLSTTTDKAKTLHFGLGVAGTYHFRVRYQVKTEAVCSERSTEEIVCKGDLELKCFKDANNQYANDVCDVAANKTTDEAICGDDGYLTPCYRGDTQSIIWEEETNVAFCTDVLAPDTGCNQDSEFPDLNTPDPVDTGLVKDDRVEDALFRTYQFQEVCGDAGVEFKCIAYDNVLDPNALNVQYNFTWWGSKLSPLTNGTEAFNDFLERPAWYQDKH